MAKKNNQKRYTFRILTDIKRDAQNWWQACNRISHGTNWGSRIDPDLLKKIKGKEEQESYKFLIPYLENKYKEEDEKIKKFIKKTTTDFEKNFSKACEKMVNITGRPLYRNDFTIYVTTFPRGPYNKREGSMLIFIEWGQPLKSFLHELCHFQFIHYWGENNDKNIMKLSQKEFEYLKESLTVVIDENFFPMIENIDYGYPMHQEFRKKLRERWKEEDNFQELISFGIKELPSYASK